MNDEKATDTHDIGNGVSGGDTTGKPKIICEPIPFPPDRQARHSRFATTS